MFNLFNFGDELTLPEQVEQNKQNIEVLAEEVEKLGFSPKGEYDALTEYVKNDLVFYDGKMYAVKSDVAVVGVVPTNTEYWQQITGDVRGQAGAPGAPGAQGEKGDDGADGLTFTGYFIAQQPPVYHSERYFTNTLFNRTPKVNDTFVAYYKVGDTVYLTMYRVLSVDSTQAYCRLYQDPILLNGAQGEPGEIALVYDHNINAGTLDPEQSEQLLNVVLPFANFNRTPALNEDFVGVLVAQNIEYLAQCEVQSIIGSNVVSIVVSGVKRLTGEPGADGTNGTNGLDALVYMAFISRTTPPVASTTTTLPTISFNRTPRPLDYFTPKWTDSVTGKTYQCFMRVDTLDQTNTNVAIVEVQDITGAAGSSGLNKYTIVPTSVGQIYRILTQAKSAKIMLLISGTTNYYNASYVINPDASIAITGLKGRTNSSDNCAIYHAAMSSSQIIPGYAMTLSTSGTTVGGYSSIQTLSNWKIEYLNDTEIV